MGTIGIDVGSTVAKFARVENDNSEIELYSCKLYGNPLECVKKVFQETGLCHGDEKICVTGSSRNLVGDYYHAEVIKPEIIAHVYGIQDHLSESDMIIEIGGQDSKLILLQNGIITNFRMNSNCAAGTGSFIEAQARRYGLALEELNELAKNDTKPFRLNAKCATFLESSLINLQRTGVQLPQLAKTIFWTLANNYITSLCDGVDIEKYKDIFFIGGVAKLSEMRIAFQEVLGREIITPENCEYMGAIGMLKLADKKPMQEIPKEESDCIECQNCENHCVLNGITINGVTSYIGGICGKHDTL